MAAEGHVMVPGDGPVKGGHIEGSFFDIDNRHLAIKSNFALQSHLGLRKISGVNQAPSR